MWQLSHISRTMRAWSGPAVREQEGWKGIDLHAASIAAWPSSPLPSSHSEWPSLSDQEVAVQGWKTSISAGFHSTENSARFF